MNDINWNAIFGFWLVADSRSFAAAARALPRGSVQALHKRVRTLEAELQLRLLRSRGTKGVELTEAGRRVFEVVAPIFRDFDRLIAELRGENSGPLHIAATGFACHNFLPDIFSVFGPRFPNVSVHVHMRETAEVLSMVEALHVDFGLCVPPAELGKCEIRVKVPLPAAILVSQNHRFRRGVRSWKEVVEEPLILPERESLLRIHFDQLMDREQLSGCVHVKGELTAPGLCVEAVRSGLGVGLVEVGPRLLAGLERVVALEPPPGLPEMNLAIICHKGRYFTKYMQSFLDVSKGALQRRRRGRRFPR